MLASIISSTDLKTLFLKDVVLITCHPFSLPFNSGEYGGKYIIMWNAEKNMVESYFFSTGGEIILSKATISVNIITIEEDFSKNGNRIKKVKKIYKLNIDGTLENKIKYFINNVWVNSHSMRYVQSDSAKVIFR